MATDRVERMVDTAPYYYQYSRVYEAIQAAPAAEYDSLETMHTDIKNQLYIPTATWGLKYWEDVLNIPIIEADSYEIRRSRVLSQWRGFGSFSAQLIKTVCESYVNGEVAVAIDIPAQEVSISFIGPLGSPPNIGDLQACLDNVIHAHLGLTYVYRYLTIDQVQGMTINQLQARPLTDFAPFTPVV